MNRICALSFSLLMIVTASGCVSKSAANARARAAYQAGQNEARAEAASATSVWIVGNVQTPTIPWTEDLTLAKALIIANYRGPRDPSQFIIRRNGQPAINVSARQLLNGYDLPLAAGDRVEVRP